MTANTKRRRGRQSLTDANRLSLVNPKVAAEWHPTKNGNITPKDVTASGSPKVWWRCAKGHEWKASTNGRSKGSGCPYCSGRNASSANCLETRNPELSKEWHPKKNGVLTSRDFGLFSNKKVWWMCKRGHEWLASVGNRSQGRGCPFCNSASSRLQLRVFSELQRLFTEVEFRKKIRGLECDVFVADLNLGIELDGLYWHRSKAASDEKKTLALANLGVVVIRLREIGLERLSSNDLFYSSKNKDTEIMCNLVRRILTIFEVQSNLRKSLSEYVRCGELINDQGYRQLLDMLPSPLPGESLLDLRPELAKQWHPSKNGRLTSRDVSLGSGLKAWWICSKGHEWEALVASRVRGLGCPFCSNKAVCDDNCLATINPALAKDWHPSKNLHLTPKDVTPKSGKKVWWICEKGHEWGAIIYSRSAGNGCPYCSNRSISKANSLAAMNFSLAKEWHGSRNNELTPNDVVIGSHKKVWWICVKGHEWKAAVADRHQRGTGCPYCEGQRVCVDNCMAALVPELAAQWHPTSNGVLTAQDLRPNSNRKVWWKCSKGHEWCATPNSRNRGTGCPYCSGNAVCNDNCLQTLMPKLTKEWHPTKNNSLTPDDVTLYSNKKVWWLCSKRHEWQASIATRSKGHRCPFCCNQRICDDNCLLRVNPALATQWHPTKNGNLSPREVAPSSQKKAWWKCSKGHEWQATVANRTYGYGCPYCSGRYAVADTCLKAQHPDLAKEWHPTQNGSCKATDVKSGSCKKAWWLCAKGHAWEARIAHRANGSGCPYCSGRKK